MNIAIILAGGTGSRMKSGNIPKQYMLVANKPIFTYCVDTFQENENIDGIIIVAEKEWHDEINIWIDKNRITKFMAYANPGRTRQHSIYNGLKEANERGSREDIVIIHDAARPLVSNQIINACIKGAKESGGAMPVLPMKDTVYLSTTGTEITGLLNRDEIYAGQAPEAFHLGKYIAIHDQMSDEELGNVRGSSEIAYRNGLEIKLVEGSEMNFKITTREDLKKFEAYLANGEN